MIGLLLAGVFLIVFGAYMTKAPKIVEDLVVKSLTEAEFTRVITGPWGMGHDVEAGNIRRILSPSAQKKLKKIQALFLLAGVLLLGFAFSIDEVRNPRAASTTITLLFILLPAPIYFYWRITERSGSKRRLINILEIMRWSRLPYLIGQFFLTLLHFCLLMAASVLVWNALFKGFSLIL